MRSLLTVSCLLLVALSGCVEDAPEDAAGDRPAPSTDAKDSAKGDRLAYEVDPDSANESELMGAHTHDEWGQNDELILMDGSVATADCSDPFRTAALAFFGLVTQQEAHVGCAAWRLDDEAVVPEGTAWLRIEVDAEAALQQGGMRLTYDNEAIERTTMDATTDPVYSWRIPVSPIEWDLPHSTETAWWFLLEPDGQASILDGTVDVFVVAERMPEWTPVLGSAHIDHWAEDADHAFVAEGVYRALDANTTVVMPSFADRVSEGSFGGFSGVALEDIVAPGATQVTLAVTWDDVSGCPAGHACWLVSFLNPGNSQRVVFTEPVETGPGWAVYLWQLPETLEPDSTYAEDSVYVVNSFVRACPEADIPQPVSMPFLNGCMGEAVATMEADTRFRMEVWQGPADLSAAKARVQIG